MRDQNVERPVAQSHFFMLRWVLALVMLASLPLACNRGKEQAQQQNQELQKLQSQVNDLQASVKQKDDRVRELEKDKSDLESRKVESEEVARGDSQWKLGYDFLTDEKKVPDEEAKRLLSKTALSDDIQIGNRVWQYYHDGVYGTFLTQGTADVSPGAVQRFEKKQIQEEKETLVAQVSDLKQDIQQKSQELQQESARLQNLTEEKASTERSLNAKIESLTGQINKLEKEQEVLTSRLNAVYYIAGTKDDLEKRNVIKGTFLGLWGMKVKDVKLPDYNRSMDLRESQVIRLQASDLGLARIKDVHMLPKFLEKDKDYRIEISANGETADVQLLNEDTFRLARIILYAD